jgi:hypothetical protein
MGFTDYSFFTTAHTARYNGELINGGGYAVVLYFANQDKTHKNNNGDYVVATVGGFADETADMDGPVITDPIIIEFDTLEGPILNINERWIVGSPNMDPIQYSIAPFTEYDPDVVTLYQLQPAEFEGAGSF